LNTDITNTKELSDCQWLWISVADICNQPSKWPSAHRMRQGDSFPSCVNWSTVLVWK